LQQYNTFPPENLSTLIRNYSQNLKGEHSTSKAHNKTTYQEKNKKYSHI